MAYYYIDRKYKIAYEVEIVQHLDENNVLISYEHDGETIYKVEEPSKIASENNKIYIRQLIDAQEQLEKARNSISIYEQSVKRLKRDIFKG